MFMQTSLGALVTEGLARTAANESRYAEVHQNSTSLVVADLGSQMGWGASNYTFSNGYRL